jgi:hypothetical protein
VKGPPLYFMAPAEPNAALIAFLGVYSYNRIHAVPEIADLSVSIADPFVNNRRHGKPLAKRGLHDFVPLYWATHTPMQYVVTQKPGGLPQEQLVFFVFDSADVLAIPGVWTTDGNAASNDTMFYEGSDALPYLDWDIIRTPDCWSREYKRRKCAEVLVPDHIPAGVIEEVCVYSDAARRALTRGWDGITDPRGEPIAAPPVIVDHRLYY